MKVGFSKNMKIMSRIIRALTRSEASHTYLHDEVSGLVFHAHGLAVQAVAIENFRKENQIVWETDALEVNWNWLRLQLGKPYGAVTLLGHVGPLLLGTKNPFRDGDSSFVCSELVARVMDLPNAENLRPDELLHHLRDGTPLP